MDRRPFTEIGVAALVIAISATFLVQANKLPPGTFEPLGSGPVPRYTAAIIIVCGLVIMARAALSLRRGPPLHQAFMEEFTGGSPLGGLLMLAGTVAYVTLLHLQAASFGVISFVFLVVLIMSLERFQLRRLPTAVLVAAFFAFGAEYLFTHFFTVDLPT